jgi:hypothetical protein
MSARDGPTMRRAHRFHVKVLRDTHGIETYHQFMNLTEAGSTATRTLTIVLPEAEWQALRTAEPDAIGWLQAQIRQRLGEQPSQRRFNSPSGATNESWADDEY